MSQTEFRLLLLGPASTGKTTFIASLCEEKTRKVIMECMQDKRFRHTVANYRYCFMSSDVQGADELVVYTDAFYSKCKQSGSSIQNKVTNAYYKLKESLHTDDFTSFTKVDKYRMSIPIDWGIDICLKECTEIPDGFAEIVDYVKINVEASAALKDYMLKAGIEKLELIDTPGFGTEYWVDAENFTCYRPWDAYVGYDDIQGVFVFNSPDSIYLSKHGKIYQSVFRDAFLNKPICILSRSILMRMYCMLGDREYTVIIGDKDDIINKTNEFRGMEEQIDKAIPDYMGRMYNRVIKQEYTQRLFLPDVLVSDEQQLAVLGNAALNTVMLLVQSIQQFEELDNNVCKNYGGLIMNEFGSYLHTNFSLSEKFVEIIKCGKFRDMTGPRGGIQNNQGKSSILHAVAKDMYSVIYQYVHEGFKTLEKYPNALERQTQVVLYSMLSTMLQNGKLNNMECLSLQRSEVSSFLISQVFQQVQQAYQKNKNVDVENLFILRILEHIIKTIKIGLSWQTI